MGLTINETIYAKIQPTLGIDSIPAGADAMAISGPPSLNVAEGVLIAEREVIRAGSLGGGSPIIGGSLVSISVVVEMKHSGVIDTPPEWAVLARACGWLQTINATTSVVLTPKSASHEIASIYIYHDGTVYKIMDARGNMSFAGTVGKIPKLTFNLIGRMVEDSSDASAPAATLDSSGPLMFMAANFLSLDAYNPMFADFSWDGGLNVTPGVNANSADGYGEIRLIGPRNMRGSINPDMTLVATQDWINEWKAGTTQALTMTLGAAGGNRVTHSIPILKYMEPSFGDRDGVRTIEMGFKAEESASLNDEITITLL